jgi:SAM-dependent methyltransferase
VRSFDFNRTWWDEAAPVHAASPDYAFARFAEDRSFLSSVVRFDLPRLGDVRGLEGVHLQCHIGTDTVSLARLGAHMVGLDFSEPAVAEARRLAALAGADATFVAAGVYEAPAVLGEARSDFVYTGVGALNWLPNVRRWAQVVAALLKPGGKLHVREGHPVLWALADARSDSLLVLEYPYFERAEPTIWNEAGTYVETDHVFTATTTHEWNHGLGEIVTALLEARFEITMFEEHDSVPWEALPGQMENIGGGEWRLADRPERLPHTYTLQATYRP